MINRTVAVDSSNSNSENNYPRQPHHAASVASLKSDIGSGIVLDGNLAFIVIGVERYHLDSKFSDVTDIRDAPYVDAYDITLTDNKHKIKCVMSPHLNKHVSSGRLLTGMVIFVKRWEICMDEADLHASGLLLIHNLHIFESFSPTQLIQGPLRGSFDIPWSPECTDRETQPRPLVTTRGSYVALWSTYEPYGSMWYQPLESTSTHTDDYDVVTIRELSRIWRTQPHTCYPTLIVRVLRKSRLLSYPKPHQSEKWPYQFQFVIGDRSGCCTAVAWTSMCPRLFCGLEEGAVLAINNYTVREHFVVSTKSTTQSTPTQSFNIDVNINPSNPSTSVLIVNDELIGEDLALPDLDHGLLSFSEIRSAPNNLIFDVVGETLAVSRLERCKHSQKTGTDSGAYAIYRSVTLWDGQSSVDLQLFSAAQPKLVDSLTPGMVLLCRHMRLVRHRAPLVSPRSFSYHLTSTHETQIRVLHPDDPLCTHIPSIGRLFTSHSHPPGTLVLGGLPAQSLFWFPDTQAEVEDFRAPDDSLTITPSREWQALVNGIAYKETRRVTLHAFLASVHTHWADNDLEFYQNRWSPDRILTETDRENGRTINDQYPPPRLSFTTRDGLTVQPVPRVEGVTLALTPGDLGYVYTPRHERAIRAKLALPPAKCDPDCGVTSQSSTDCEVYSTNEQTTPVAEYLRLDLLSLTHSLVLTALCPHPCSTLAHLHPDPVVHARPLFDAFPRRQRWLCSVRLHRPDYSRVEALVDRLLALS